MHSALTTAALSWSLGRQQCLSHLSLYDARAQSVTNAFSAGSSASQHTVRGLQPATRYRAGAAVTTFLKHLEISLNQRLRINMETGRRRTVFRVQLDEPSLLPSRCDADVLTCLCSSVSSWLVGPQQQLLRPSTGRSDLECSPAQMHRCGTWGSPG